MANGEYTNKQNLGSLQCKNIVSTKSRAKLKPFIIHLMLGCNEPHDEILGENDWTLS